MILGSGIDIIEVGRIQASYERFGERFVNRILRPGEIAYCHSHKNPAPFLAARFSAKEAVSKAFEAPLDQVKNANLLLGNIGETAVLARHKQLPSVTLIPFRPMIIFS